MKKGPGITGKWYESIGFRISASFAALIFLTILILSQVFMAEERSHTEMELHKTGSFLGETLAKQAVLPLLQRDLPALDNLIRGFRKGPPNAMTQNFVDYIWIVGLDGKPLVQTGTPKWARTVPNLPALKDLKQATIQDVDDRHFEVVTPIRHQDMTIGLVRAGITQTARYELLDAVEKKVFWTTGTLLIIGILVGIFSGRRLSKPLVQLAAFARRIGEREWGKTVPVSGSGEIQTLIQTFNEMSSKLKEAFEKTQKAQNRLVQAEKFSALGKLSANLAHELKNPLTSIKMIMETATDRKDQMDFDLEDAEVMLYEIKRMENTVQEILSFAGPRTLSLRGGNVNHLVQAVLAQVRYKLEIAGIGLNVSFDETIPEFSFDPKLMEQAFMNLAVNAIQAMPQGGELTVQTQWQPIPPHVQIQLQDTGDGIPPQVRHQIFDPFFTTKESGTGLGLSIVYANIRDHGGHIELLDRQGGGTHFMITLPVKEQEHAPDPDRG